MCKALRYCRSRERYCSDPKKLDTKVPGFILARVLAVEPANSAQIQLDIAQRRVNALAGIHFSQKAL